MVGMAKDNQKNSEMILEIEQNLQRVLRPVQPRTDFVERLENRLVTYPQISIEKRSSPVIIFSLFFGVALMIPLFWIVWRYIIRKLVR
jgi:hypothetical protein